MARDKRAKARRDDDAAQADRAPELQLKAQRLWEVNRTRKALEREEDELRDWFKEKAGGKPTDFEAEDVVVSVQLRSRNSLDTGLLRTFVTDELLGRCQREVVFTEVQVRKVKD